MRIEDLVTSRGVLLRKRENTAGLAQVCPDVAYFLSFSQMSPNPQDISGKNAARFLANQRFVDVEYNVFRETASVSESFYKVRAKIVGVRKNSL